MGSIRTFFVTLAGTASVLGIIYIAAILLAGQNWISSNAIVILSHGIYWLVVPPIIVVLIDRPSKDAFSSPKVRKVLDGNTLLVEGKTWLGHQTAVAVFRIEDDVEKLVAIGEVINIQSNGLVQISCAVPSNFNAHLPNLSDIKTSLMIKPGIKT